MPGGQLLCSVAQSWLRWEPRVVRSWHAACVATGGSGANGEWDAADIEGEAAVQEAPLPGRTLIFGAALAFAAGLPLLPDGRCFLDLVRESFSRSLMEGALMLLGLGSPFVFGLAVVLAGRMANPAVGARIVRAPIAMMHSQLVLVAWALWKGGAALAALPLLGFSIASGIYFAAQVAMVDAQGRGPSLRFHIRWGAMIVLAIAAWARLQMFVGVYFGSALSVVIISAALLVRSTRPAAAK